MSDTESEYESDSGISEGSEVEYTIERILGRRKTLYISLDGEVIDLHELYVKWEGYDEPTWEPRWALMEDCPEFVRRWERGFGREVRVARN